MTAARKILVVDDDSGIRETLQLALEIEGFEVVLAENGRAALDALEDGGASPPLCLILLDLMMPLMNGWEFLKVYRRSEEWANIPVVLVTAFASEAIDVKPPVPIVAKPIDIEVLLGLVEKFCK